ncbi:MAG: hypothetical protein K0S76_2405 [Herbinix sp.]|jgi:hypothetical protein|nr:hypothetical protein [Herbinix sp.]
MKKFIIKNFSIKNTIMNYFEDILAVYEREDKKSGGRIRCTINGNQSLPPFYLLLFVFTVCEIIRPLFSYQVPP